MKSFSDLKNEVAPRAAYDLECRGILPHSPGYGRAYLDTVLALAVAAASKQRVPVPRGDTPTAEATMRLAVRGIRHGDTGYDAAFRAELRRVESERQTPPPTPPARSAPRPKPSQRTEAHGRRQTSPLLQQLTPAAIREELARRAARDGKAAAGFRQVAEALGSHGLVQLRAAVVTLSNCETSRRERYGAAYQTLLSSSPIGWPGGMKFLNSVDAAERHSTTAAMTRCLELSREIAEQLAAVIAQAEAAA